MRYFIGFDGGATKSEAVLVNSLGEILAYQKCGDTNYQNIGIENTYELINESVNKLLLQANLKINDIDFSFLGLAGADLESDFKILNENLSPIFLNRNFEIKNDAWVALAIGSHKSYGAVSICGTSHNIAVRNRSGEEQILLSLSYEAGNFGGGGDIARQGLHNAFRAYEQTNEQTILTSKIPKAFGKNTMEEIIEIVGFERYTKEQLHAIPKMVFDSALEGDKVSQEIIISMGKEIGKALAGKIKMVGMQFEPIPVVLSGSIHTKVSSRLHIDSLSLELKREVPYAEIVINDSPPVIGGVIEAMRRTGVTINEDLFQKMKGVRL